MRQSFCFIGVNNANNITPETLVQDSVPICALKVTLPRGPFSRMRHRRELTRRSRVAPKHSDLPLKLLDLFLDGYDLIEGQATNLFLHEGPEARLQL